MNSSSAASDIQPSLDPAENGAGLRDSGGNWIRASNTRMELRQSGWPIPTSFGILLSGMVLAGMATDDAKGFGWSIAGLGGLGLLAAGLYRWMGVRGHLDRDSDELFLTGYAYWDNGLRLRISSLVSIQLLHYQVADSQVGLPTSCYQVNLLHAEGRVLIRATSYPDTANVLATEISQFLGLPLVHSNRPGLFQTT